MGKEMAAYIDHTQLKPETTAAKMRQIIQEARDHQFASVCVTPYWVSFCYENLQDTDVKVCAVIGFPLGATTTEVKEVEAKQAIQNGATEVDMVLNIGELKSEHDDVVKQDIEAVVSTAQKKALVKVIIETCLLNKEEKVRACQLAKEAGADFVKTSTGFSDGGATQEDVALMRDTVGSEMGVKASGGIRDAQTVKMMIEAGASRIGASSGVSIIAE